MEHTLTHYRRVLGEDHPVTLRLAHNLAAGLRARGEHEQARELDADTLSHSAGCWASTSRPAKYMTTP